MARSKSGNFGVYNSTPITLSNEDGAAVALDVNGRIILGSPVATAAATYSENIGFGTVTKAVVKASAGNVLGVYASNINAAIRYFQLHNKATAPAGTDVPIFSWPIGAGSATAVSTLILDQAFFSAAGRYFATGIGWAVSTTIATFTDSATASDHATVVNFL